MMVLESVEASINNGSKKGDALRFKRGITH